MKNVESALARISAERLHGSDQPPPNGFLRGIDVLGQELPKRIAGSCNAYRARHGRTPELIAPKTFTEKQVLFKFYAPVPISPPPSDKLRNGVYIPEGTREKVTIPRRFCISDKPELPQNGDIGPGTYFFKSNHGSATNCRVTFPMNERTRTKLEAKARRWLSLVHGRGLSLWWNEAVERRVYLEENLGLADGDAPDWKFFVFNGKVELIQVDVDRFGDHVQTIYDRTGKFLDQELYFKSGPPVDMPVDLDAMIDIAEAIGRRFDFVRVDMFRMDGAIFLGELGLVLTGATLRVRSPELDERLGEVWKAPWIGRVAPGFAVGHYATDWKAVHHPEREAPTP